MSINKKSNQIDLDAGDILYHIKVNSYFQTNKECAFRLKGHIFDFSFLSKAKSHELFYIWVTKLQAHRLYKKHEAAHVHSSFLQTLSHGIAAGQAGNGDLVIIK